MNKDSLFRLAVWSAILSAIATLGGVLSVIAYPVWGFWLGRIWLRNAKG